MQKTRMLKQIDELKRVQEKERIAKKIEDEDI